MDLDTVFRHYLDCALWSSVEMTEDGNGEPLDESYDADDIAPEALVEMRADVEAFVADNTDDLALAGQSDEQIGHDFWLTRNHHGAGFWDRGLGPVGDRLTKAAHVYGEVDLYVGDDDQLYV